MPYSLEVNCRRSATVSVAEHNLSLKSIGLIILVYSVITQPKIKGHNELGGCMEEPKLKIKISGTKLN